MSVSMGAVGESAAAIATLLKHSPMQCELSPNFGDGRAGQAAAVVG